MKLLNLVVLFLLLTASCATQNRCNRLFPPDLQTQTDTISVVTYVTDTVTFHIPGDTVYRTEYITVGPDGLSNSPRSVLNVAFARSTAQVINGQLKHQLIQLDSLLTKHIQNKTTTITVTDTIIETRINTVYRLAWYHWLLIVSLAVVAVLALLKG